MRTTFLHTKLIMSNIEGKGDGRFTMPTVYLKGGDTVQVSLEELEDYLYQNQERIETRRKQVRRPVVDSSTVSTSNK